jgi:TetR/AcrR family transcriptional regulator, transcriptional repressor for nem operon
LKADGPAEAVMRALKRSGEKQSRYLTLIELLSEYLSERHCADRANGYAVAALGADIAREHDGLRRVLSQYVRGQLDRIARLLRNGPAGRRRKRPIATLAGMVGALTLARAVDDPALSKEILAAARDILGEARLTRERRC